MDTSRSSRWPSAVPERPVLVVSMPSRVPAGTGGRGGQFAASQHSESDVEVAEQFPPPRSKGQGRWEVSDTVAEELSTDGPVQRTAFHFGGQPHRAQRNKAAIALMHEVDDHETTVNKLGVLCKGGAQMTYLAADGSGSVEAKEVRGYPMGDRLAVQRKGATRAAYALNSDAVLAVAPGYGKQEVLAQQFHDRLAQVPRTAPVDFDGIPDHEAAARESEDYPEPPETIAAAYLVDNPDFQGGTVDGCMFLATDYDQENDIVNGYLWAPESSGLTSEHGSAYGADLKRRGGRITNYEPGQLSFADCVNDGIPPSRSEAYRCVTGLSFYPE